MSAESRLAHYRRLESQLATAKQAVAAKQAEIDAFLLSVSPVQEGDIVELRGGAHGRVVHVDTSWLKIHEFGVSGIPWVRVNVRRKDGSWSNAQRNAYNDWKTVEPATPAPHGVAR